MGLLERKKRQIELVNYQIDELQKELIEQWSLETLELLGYLVIKKDRLKKYVLLLDIKIGALCL